MCNSRAFNSQFYDRGSKTTIIFARLKSFPAGIPVSVLHFSKVLSRLVGRVLSSVTRPPVVGDSSVSFHLDCEPIYSLDKLVTIQVVSRKLLRYYVKELNHDIDLLWRMRRTCCCFIELMRFNESLGKFCKIHYFSSLCEIMTIGVPSTLRKGSKYNVTFKQEVYSWPCQNIS